MKTLLEIYNKHKVGDWPDKNSVHSYIPVYEELLAPYRETAKNILEIGLMSGESLRMWTEYFSGDVHGIDCSIKPINGLADLEQAIADGLKISIGDATSEADIEKFYGDIMFDVVVDDGSHLLIHQIQSFNILKSKMKPRGVYVIEDAPNIDEDLSEYRKLHDDVEIVDRRTIKNRFDDVLILIRF